MSQAKHAESPLCEYLDQLVEDLRELVPQALEKFDADAIHKARVATRRIKAGMELLESILDQNRAEPFSKLGKKLRRRLGPLRDIDVMIGHLAEIPATHRAAPGAAWFKQRLEEQRQEFRARANKKVSVSQTLSGLKDWWALRQDLLDSRSKVPGLLEDSVKDQLDQFVKNADALSASHDPHELRIAGKSLRYTLEMAREEGLKIPATVLRLFKQMQDRLGLWHDYVVLAERAMEACLDVDLPLHDPQMQRQVLDLIAHILKRAEQELAKFAQLWAKQGQELYRVIRAAIEGDATQSETVPDPADLSTVAAPEDVSQAPPTDA